MARSHLAAFSAADGSLLGWAPTADDSVKTMVLTPDGSRVIVGGMFLNLNGSPASGLGALDATSGTLLPWAATNLIKEGGSASGISDLSTDGTEIYGSTWAFGCPSRPCQAISQQTRTPGPSTGSRTAGATSTTSSPSTARSTR